MVEWGTPDFILEAARNFLGEIHLDPASSQAHNKRVGAHHIITRDDNALARPWHAPTLWLNHPFSKGYLPCDPATCRRQVCQQRGYHLVDGEYSNGDWISYLDQEYRARRAQEALNITFASTGTEWGQLQLRYPVVFLYPRTPYIHPDTGRQVSGVPRGSMIAYRGYLERVGEFVDTFGKFGRVQVPMDMEMWSDLHGAWYRPGYVTWIERQQRLEALRYKRGSMAAEPMIWIGGGHE